MVVPALALAIIAADLNHDGIINSGDTSMIFNQWGQQGVADLNMDGIVDTHDLLRMLSVWKCGWGAHSTGDGKDWFVEPGQAVSIGPSPFSGLRRLRFVSPNGDVVAIDIEPGY